jgi:hypothetical protein
MSKKTAVQWLVEQVNSDCLNSSFIRPDLIKQAEEMEKEQIIDAYAIGKYLNNDDRTFAEQYYAETYGKSNS